MKKLALTSLLVMSFVATSYANDLTGVTDVHLRFAHKKDGTVATSVVGAKHLSGSKDDAESATLFFGKIADAAGVFGSSIKDAVKESSTYQTGKEIKKGVKDTASGVATAASNLVGNIEIAAATNPADLQAALNAKSNVN
jgi:hypothetical protein